MASTPSRPSTLLDGREPSTDSSSSNISLGKVVAGTLLLALLTIAGTYVFGGFTGLSSGGVAALVLGVSFSYALGVGLMVAVFHSSRFYDEDAHNATLDQFKDRQDS